MGDRSAASPELAAFRASRDLLRILSATTDVAPASQAILEVACRVEAVDCGGVYLVDQASGALRLTAHRGLPSEFIDQTSTYTADAPEAALVRAGRAIYLNSDDLAALDHVPSARVCLATGVRALAVLPVQLDGRVVAVLNLVSF